MRAPHCTGASSSTGEGFTKSTGDVPRTVTLHASGHDEANQSRCPTTMSAVGARFGGAMCDRMTAHVHLCIASADSRPNELAVARSNVQWVGRPHPAAQLQDQTSSETNRHESGRARARWQKSRRSERLPGSAATQRLCVRRHRLPGQHGTMGDIRGQRLDGRSAGCSSRHRLRGLA